MTTGKIHSVKVTIVNEEYTLRSDVEPEHTRAVARYVDEAIREIIASGAVVETGRAAILAALRITGELFEARAAADRIRADTEALSSEVRRMLPPAKRAPV